MNWKAFNFIDRAIFMCDNKIVSPHSIFLHWMQHSLCLHLSKKCHLCIYLIWKNHYAWNIQNRHDSTQSRRALISRIWLLLNRQNLTKLKVFSIEFISYSSVMRILWKYCLFSSIGSQLFWFESSRISRERLAQWRQMCNDKRATRNFHRSWNWRRGKMR